MRKVGDLTFWKERIDDAKKHGKLHYSVYVANEALWKRIFEIHLDTIWKHIKPTDNVLDLACGYGRLSPLFNNYTGVDFSPDFINEANTLYPGKRFLCENIKKLPFKDKEFDWGIAISLKAMIINNLGIEEWTPMEKEIRRVCKKTLILEYGIHESRADTDNTIGKYEVL
jgi:SAM-dependent methyltransferase